MAGNDSDRSGKAKLAFAIIGLLVGLGLILVSLGVLPNPFAAKPPAPVVTEDMKQDFEKQQKKAEEAAKERPPSGA